MATIWACTHIEKRVEEDDFEHGCNPDSSTFTMDEKCHHEAPNLAALIDVIRRHYCLAMDDLWLPEDDSVIDRFGFNRLEDADGCEVLEGEALYQQWQSGKVKCWLADYDFSIEQYETLPITVADFDHAGIKHHA